MYVRTWVFMAVTRRSAFPSQVDGRRELDREAEQHKRAGLHHARRDRPGRNPRMHVRKHARTRVRRGWCCGVWPAWGMGRDVACTAAVERARGGMEAPPVGWGRAPRTRDAGLSVRSWGPLVPLGAARLLSLASFDDNQPLCLHH